MADLKSMADYKEEIVADLNATHPVEASGIACPACQRELDWAERSLFATAPRMRRLVCPECEFSEVVPVL